ncbi:MAG: protein phosphatase 2C domain-containing protein [Chthoniobacter sp.]
MTGSQGPRAEQQDSGICLHDDAQGTALIVVGDGVGGRSGGRIASQKVIELASRFWEERKGRLAKPEEDLATLCQVAHEHINSEGSKLGISPRTTIVALYLNPTNAWWVHSGDSRMYHFRAGQLVERTEDHSLLEIMVQRGAVKEEDMGRHPDQHTLLQSLGGEEFMPPSSGTAQITPDDGFLLCTDGFWERTSPEEMSELVFGERSDANERLSAAVERALERNGTKGDNVTVALAMPARAKAAVAPPISRPNVTLLVTACVLLVLAAGFFFWPEPKSAPTSSASARETAAPKVFPVEKTQSAEKTRSIPPPIPRVLPEEKLVPSAVAQPADLLVTPPTPSAGPTPIVPPKSRPADQPASPARRN